MVKPSMVVAGIDVAKAHLDIAVHGHRQVVRVANTPDGFGGLMALIQQHQVQCVGLEASGGYERDVTASLRAAGIAVIVLQPLQVRAYAKIRLQRAKTDRIDALLIAAFVHDHADSREAPDPRLQPLADLLTGLEHIEEDTARLKVRLEHVRHATLRSQWKADIDNLRQRRASLIAAIVRQLRQHEDLARRFDLVLSVEGIGQRTAIALIVRMPELGRLSREQAAALAGLAPFNNDSGKRVRTRSIAGGRTRLRTSLYAAALPAAFRWNKALVDLYKRLIAAGKPHKLALVACARKLLVYANTVVARGSPWIKIQTAS